MTKEEKFEVLLELSAVFKRRNMQVIDSIECALILYESMVNATAKLIVEKVEQTSIDEQVKRTLGL